MGVAFIGPNPAQLVRKASLESYSGVVPPLFLTWIRLAGSGAMLISEGQVFG